MQQKHSKPHHQPPELDLSMDLDSPPPEPKNHRLLTISFIASIILLVASIGFFVWRMGLNPVTVAKTLTTTSDGSEKARDVSFVTPADLPAAYAKRDQSTNNSQLAIYADDNTNCRIVTGTKTIDSGAEVKATAQQLLAAQNIGVTDTESTDSQSVKLSDASANQKYEFKTQAIDQSVSMPGVSYNQQNVELSYKQFGQKVALIAAICRADQWSSKKPELSKLITNFKVKVQK